MNTNADYFLAPQLFGACLSELLNRHGVPASALSHALGHKSRTTLRRILTDQANAQSMEKFLEEFLRAAPVALSAEEERALRQSLEVSRAGLARYRARQEMWRFVNGPAAGHRTAPLHLTNVHTGDNAPLSLFLDELAQAADVRFLIFNGVPAPFFEALRDFIIGAKGRCRVDVEHYFFLNDDMARTVRFVATVLPLLKFPNHSVCAIPAPSPEEALFSFITAPIVVCRAELPQNEVREYQIGFSEPGVGQMIPLPARAGVYTFWENMLSPFRSRMMPIKTTYPAPDILSGYIQLAEKHRRLEHNRAIAMLKPSLNTALIEPSLLSAALVENLDRSALAAHSELAAVKDRFMDIQDHRFRNLYEKKRITRILMPVQSIREFAQTGVIPEHAFAMRPFTPQERVRILTHCRDQARNNPYFNLHFLKSDLPRLDIEATCFEHTGVMFHSAGQTYELFSPRVDALVALPDFTALFAQFLREELIPQFGMSVCASAQLLTALIDKLQTKE